MMMEFPLFSLPPLVLFCCFVGTKSNGKGGEENHPLGLVSPLFFFRHNDDVLEGHRSSVCVSITIHASAYI